MNTVINRILQDHRNSEQLLALIERETAQLERGEFANVPLLADIMHYFVNYPDLYHHPLEDQVFAILKRKSAATAAQVDHVYSEHVQMGEAAEGLLERTTELQGNAMTPRDQVIREFRDYVAQYRDHIRREEQELLPAADRALGAADWSALEKQFATGADPLFGRILQRQYQTLYEVIMAEAGKRS